MGERAPLLRRYASLPEELVARLHELVLDDASKIQSFKSLQKQQQADDPLASMPDALSGGVDNLADEEAVGGLSLDDRISTQ